jgi:hypothetical protein
MGLRYEDVPDSVANLLRDVKAQHFPELRNANIKVLFDLKKRTSGGQVVIARIMRTNDLLRHLTIEDAERGEGYDYIVTIDKVCWENTNDEDRARILRHELRHAYFDMDSDKNPYKLQNHSISDFYEEVEMNKDDPRWRDRVGALAESIYEQQKEARSEDRKNRTNIRE